MVRSLVRQWIAEDPSNSKILGGFKPFANFGTVSFRSENSAIVTTVSPQSQPIGAFASAMPVGQITMTSDGTSTGTIEAVPSSLSSDLSSFSVEWQGNHNIWSSGAPMPVALDDTAVAVLKNQIYVVGGGTPSVHVANNVQIYNPATNTWSTGVPLPTATGSGCAAVVNNILYFIGGNIASSGNPQYTDAVWAYNPNTQKWSSKTPMPTTAEAGAVCVVEKGIIWVMGGYGDGNFLATVEGYNPKTNTWQPGASMLSPEDSASGALIGTTILVTNGSDGYVDGNNQAYSVATNTWTLLNSDPTLRQNTCAGAIGGRLYSAGGWDDVDSAALTLTESLTLSNDVWETLTPMPKGTMGLGRSVVYNGQLYCFGGEYSTSGHPVSTVEIYQP